MLLRCSLIVLIVVFGISQINSDILGSFIDKYKFFLKAGKDLPKLIACPADQCSSKKAAYGPQTFAVGGKPSYARHYVGLYIRFAGGQQGFCGGFLISTAGAKCTVGMVRFVVTAAHCLENAVKVRVIAGRYDYSDATETDYCEFEVTSDDFTHHKKWNVTGFRNDIAIMRIKNAAAVLCLDKSPHITAIGLPTAESSLKDRVFTMTGRGVRGVFYPDVQNIAYCITLPYLSQETCSIFFSNPTDQFCCGCASEAPCSGDSGTAVVSDNMGFGIVSAGFNPCDANLPTVFTDVRGFLKWIYAYICNENQYP